MLQHRLINNNCHCTQTKLAFEFEFPCLSFSTLQHTFSLARIDILSTFPFYRSSAREILHIFNYSTRRQTGKTPSIFVSYLEPVLIFPEPLDPPPSPGDSQSDRGIYVPRVDNNT